jgi:hypothetical protein
VFEAPNENKEEELDAGAGADDGAGAGAGEVILPNSVNACFSTAGVVDVASELNLAGVLCGGAPNPKLNGDFVTPLFSLTEPDSKIDLDDSAVGTEAAGV